jgi:hypothetical protein
VVCVCVCVWGGGVDPVMHLWVCDIRHACYRKRGADGIWVLWTCLPGKVSGVSPWCCVGDWVRARHTVHLWEQGSCDKRRASQRWRGVDWIWVLGTRPPGEVSHCLVWNGVVASVAFNNWCVVLAAHARIDCIDLCSKNTVSHEEWSACCLGI